MSAHTSFFACVLLCLTPPTVGQDDNPPPPVDIARALQNQFAEVAAHVSPCVVSIGSYVQTTTARQESLAEDEPAQWVAPLTDDRYPGYERISASSGFVIDQDNAIIITARTPLLQEDGSFADLFDIETSDKLHSMAVIIGGEPTLDLAFLKIVVHVDEKQPQMSEITWGNSAEMKPGFWAFAVGDPFGIEHVFSPSVISTMPSRDCYQENLSASYLQVAMDLHPEAAGGPLVNIDGQVVGLLAPRTTSSFLGPAVGGIQFALPANIIRTIANPILERKSFNSPWVGFAVMSRAELRDEIGPRAFSKMKRPEIGIYVENVFDPSPAHDAGVQPGDFIVSFDGHPVHTPLAFQKWFYLAGIGQDVQVEVFRAGERFTKTMRIEERPVEARNR